MFVKAHNAHVTNLWPIDKYTTRGFVPKDINIKALMESSPAVQRRVSVTKALSRGTGRRAPRREGGSVHPITVRRETIMKTDDLSKDYSPWIKHKDLHQIYRACCVIKIRRPVSSVRTSGNRWLDWLWCIGFCHGLGHPCNEMNKGQTCVGT